MDASVNRVLYAMQHATEWRKGDILQKFEESQRETLRKEMEQLWKDATAKVDATDEEVQQSNQTWWELQIKYPTLFADINAPFDPEAVRARIRERKQNEAFSNALYARGHEFVWNFPEC
jgi:hypothetical protein